MDIAELMNRTSEAIFNDRADRLLNKIVIELAKMFVGVSLGYAWCFYHANLP